MNKCSELAGTVLDRLCAEFEEPAAVEPLLRRYWWLLERPAGAPLRLCVQVSENDALAGCLTDPQMPAAEGQVCFQIIGIGCLDALVSGIRSVVGDEPA
jgi:hypothetical protein